MLVSGTNLKHLYWVHFNQEQYSADMVQLYIRTYKFVVKLLTR